MPDAFKVGKTNTVLGQPVTIGFSDGKIRINDSSVQTADVEASSGVIHVIDSVLIPRQDVPRRDIYSWTWNQMRYKNLRALIDAAGYQDLIGGRNDFTIFAPNDAAFDSLPGGTLESLLKPENKEKARAILAQHIVMGRVSTGDAMNAGSMKALNGGNLKFDIAQGLFQVNGATVISTDLKRDNGVIHVIDRVLLPPVNVPYANGVDR